MATQQQDVLAEVNDHNIVNNQSTPMKRSIQTDVASPMQMTPAKTPAADDISMTPQPSSTPGENGENTPRLTPVGKANESLNSGASPARRRSKRFSTPKNKATSGVSPSPAKSATKRRAEDDKNETSMFEEIKSKRLRMADHIKSTNLCPLFTSPVVWTVECGADATDLYLDYNSFMVSTTNGAVIEMDLQGQVKKTLQLPLAASTLIKDGPFMYAWCPAKYGFQKWKGALFGLNEASPRLLFEIFDIGDSMVNAAAQNGLVVLADDRGCIFVLGCDGDLLWQVTGNDGAGKMLLTDEKAIYAGHRRKITKYCLKTGRILWSYEVTGRAVAVHTGVQDDKHIFVEVGSRVLQLTKNKGELVQEFTPTRHRASGVCIGNGLLVTGSCPTVLFDVVTGEERFRMNFPGRLNDAVVRMHPSGQLLAAWDKVYAIDITNEGIQKAVEGRSIPTKTMSVNTEAKPGAANTEIVTMTTDPGDCVILECVEKDGNIEIMPASGDYEAWSVRFPKALKIRGKRYIVDKLVPYKDYKFYGTLGEIRELVKEIPTFVERGINTSQLSNMDDTMDRSLASNTADVTAEPETDLNGNISVMEEN